VLLRCYADLIVTVVVVVVRCVPFVVGCCCCPLLLFVDLQFVLLFVLVVVRCRCCSVVCYSVDYMFPLLRFAVVGVLVALLLLR
jgi:hypothetical protein